MDRIARLLSTSDRFSRILEIGPSYNPAAPKASGWKTHVVDHAPAEQLRAKYAAASVDVGMIEDVDTIWTDGPLHQAVPGSLAQQFDTLIASHVLEHIPDLLGFLRSASELVRPGGSITLALPDRRYCFDCFQPWTSTGDVLEAHLAGRTRHSVRTAFNQSAYTAFADGQLAWGPHAVAVPQLANPFAAASALVDEFKNGGQATYTDYHAWHLTPAGFALVMLELEQLRLTDWRVEKLDGPENFEFFALLRRGVPLPFGAAGLQAQRRDLILRQLAEVREQIDFILGAQSAASSGQAAAAQTLAQFGDMLQEQNRRLAEIATTIHRLQATMEPAGGR